MAELGAPDTQPMIGSPSVDRKSVRLSRPPRPALLGFGHTGYSTRVAVPHARHRSTRGTLLNDGVVA